MSKKHINKKKLSTKSVCFITAAIIILIASTITLLLFRSHFMKKLQSETVISTGVCEYECEKTHMEKWLDGYGKTQQKTVCEFKNTQYSENTCNLNLTIEYEPYETGDVIKVAYADITYAKLTTSPWQNNVEHVEIINGNIGAITQKAVKMARKDSRKEVDGIIVIIAMIVFIIALVLFITGVSDTKEEDENDIAALE